MSNDNWQVGDLALCIDGGCNAFWAGWEPKAGHFYAVARVCAGGLDRHDRYSVGLDLVGISAPTQFAASRFVKVTPPKADEFDREVIDLMIGKPVPVEA